MSYQEFIARATEYAMINMISLDSAIEILHMEAFQ